MLTRQPEMAHPPLSPSPVPPWHEAPGLAEHSGKFLGESPGKAETAPRRAQSLQLAGFRKGMEAGRAGDGSVPPPVPAAQCPGAWSPFPLHAGHPLSTGHFAACIAHESVHLGLPEVHPALEASSPS